MEVIIAAERTRVATARQLLAYLQTLPEETLDQAVVLEGCDCADDMGAVEIYPDGITLIRSDHVS